VKKKVSSASEDRSDHPVGELGTGEDASGTLEGRVSSNKRASYLRRITLTKEKYQIKREEKLTSLL